MPTSNQLVNQARLTKTKRIRTPALMNSPQKKGVCLRRTPRWSSKADAPRDALLFDTGLPMLGPGAGADWFVLKFWV